MRFDDGKGRYVVRLMDFSKVSLKPANLKEWAAQAVPASPTLVGEGGAQADEAARVLELLRAGCVRSTDKDTAQTLYNSVLNLGGADKPLCRQYARRLYDGGAIEMVVQSMDAHMDDRGRLVWALFFIGQIINAEEDGTERSLAAEAKRRAVAAGIYDRLCAALETHTTSDVMCMALGCIQQAASGGAFVATEARRQAAAKAGALPAVLCAMALTPHKSAVQHFGILAVGAICAMDGGSTPDGSRKDAAVAAGAHETIIEAMRRHGHIRAEKGMCMHTMELADGEPIVLASPGSILQSGCQVLGILVHDSDPERIAALNAAGTLGAVAAAVRAGPKFCDSFNADNLCDLSDAKIVQPLVMKLLGESVDNYLLQCLGVAPSSSPSDDAGGMLALMNREDMMTLVGTAESPGLLLKSVMQTLEASA